MARRYWVMRKFGVGKEGVAFAACDFGGEFGEGVAAEEEGRGRSAVPCFALCADAGLEGAYMKRIEYKKRGNCVSCGVTFACGAIGEGAAQVEILAKRGIQAVDLGDRFVYGETYCPQCGTNIWEAFETEWAETCRKCGKTFEDK